MIIGIDITSIAYGTGVSNYTLNLIKELLSTDKENHYKFFFSSLRLHLPPEITTLIDKHKNSQLYSFKIPPTILAIIWNKLHIIPLEYFIGKCDVFHTSDWTQPPTINAKTICTIHDLTPFIYPQWLHPKIVSTHRQKMYWAVKEASHFICVSKNSQKDLLKLFKTVDIKKTSVIYEAAEKKYSDFYKFKPEHKLQLQNSIKSKYYLNDFLLVQGTREPRKNIHRIVQAFVNYKKQHPKSTLELAITGKFGWGEDIQTDRRDIKILGFVDENDLVQLHAAAIALVYPSLYEGFGLPVLKAMAVGTPVITSNTSSLKEICDQAGILVNPLSVNAIANAITKITKTIVRKNLIKRGIFQAKKYSWNQTAIETLKIYHQFSKN